jgi:tetrahydromethanopterin S-methyltransferase subunit F
MPSTYQELKDQIINFVNKPDIDQTVDTFIDLTEAEMSRRLRHWRMERRSTAILNSQYVPLPSDFIEPVRLSITSGDTYVLEAESQAQLIDRRAKAGNTTGLPRYYAIIDGTIEVFPTPDSDYTLEMVYVSKVQALTSSNTTNWVLDYFPDAYLYGSLMHTAPFLEEDQRLTVWSSLFEKAVESINQENANAKFGGAGLRVKIRSY